MTKEIKIIMTDEVFDKLKSEMGIKKMCDNSHGITNELLMLVISTIEKGEPLLNLEVKAPKKNRKT